jgi:hypothetical protein
MLIGREILPFAPICPVRIKQPDALLLEECPQQREPGIVRGRDRAPFREVLRKGCPATTDLGREALLQGWAEQVPCPVLDYEVDGEAALHALKEAREIMGGRPLELQARVGNAGIARNAHSTV